LQDTTWIETNDILNPTVDDIEEVQEISNISWVKKDRKGNNNLKKK
jgi:hypothetical protein